MCNLINTYIHTYISYMCLIPYILAPVYTFRCIFDVPAGLWKEEKVYRQYNGGHLPDILYC